MSRTFSTNIGSVESLKVSTRCGCRPKAPQMRCTLVTETPEALAIDRRLQWVASSGIVSSVFVTTSVILSSPILRARTRLVIKPVQALFGEPPAPGPDRQPRYVELFRNRAVVQTFRRQQHDARSRRRTVRRLAPPNACFQLAALLGAENNLHRCAAWHLRLPNHSPGDRGSQAQMID